MKPVFAVLFLLILAIVVSAQETTTTNNLIAPTPQSSDTTIWLKIAELVGMILVVIVIILLYLVAVQYGHMGRGLKVAAIGLLIYGVAREILSFSADVLGYQQGALYATVAGIFGALLLAVGIIWFYSQIMFQKQA